VTEELRALFDPDYVDPAELVTLEESIEFLPPTLERLDPSTIYNWWRDGYPVGDDEFVHLRADPVGPFWFTHPKWIREFCKEIGERKQRRRSPKPPPRIERVRIVVRPEDSERARLARLHADLRRTYGI
jgi:hypothetical protein